MQPSVAVILVSFFAGLSRFRVDKVDSTHSNASTYLAFVRGSGSRQGFVFWVCQPQEATMVALRGLEDFFDHFQLVIELDERTF